MIDTNDVAHAFGSSAFVMDVPGPTPSIDCTRAHQKHGRISMEYNIVTTVIKCSEVQFYDYEFKVRMAPVPCVNAHRLPTGSMEQPHSPIACATTCHELQRLWFNGNQLFRTAIMVCKSPETGISRVVVSYDPNDPLYQKKYEFAKRTVAHVACSMYHWLKQCGYCQSTCTRLMRSFYVEKAQLAPQSSWDDKMLTATSHFAPRTDTYLLNNTRYDPY